MKKKYYFIIASLILVFAVLIAFAMNKGEVSVNDFTVETAVVKLGKIQSSVTATGALEAIETVEVGTQVSGIVNKILVDFNSIVKKGQVLSKIDETPLIAQLNQSQALVEQAEAEFTFQSANFERNKKLFEKQLISQADFDQIMYSYSIAKANLANVKAQHDRNRINLEYATIVSPIDGVILERAVDEGQTVAASFNTPTLFTIANDLTQMKVEASVDEADIGLVKVGQRVEFTVDAFPDDVFNGTVMEVRLQPVVTNNVVTYTVIINAPNPDKKLMPGMTATTTIFVLEEEDQLLIPMQALNFEPDKNVLHSYMMSINENKDGEMQSKELLELNSEIGDADGSVSSKNSNQIAPKVWVREKDSLYAKVVKVSINDGINYSVADGLKEGDEVVLALEGKAMGISNSGATRSPFMPRPPQRD